jgi:hypothetical protein
MSESRNNAVRILLQNLRATLNERLAVINELLETGADMNSVPPTDGLCCCSDRIESLESRIRELEGQKDSVRVWAVPPIGLTVEGKHSTASLGQKEITIAANNMPTINVSKIDAPAEEDEAELAEAEQADAEEAEAEEVEAEEAEDDQAEEEEGEEVEVGLTEFTYRGRTFYRDPDNYVYPVDADGEIMDDPVGTWDETRQRVVRLPTPES